MRILIFWLTIVLTTSIPAISKQSEIADRKNRVSFRAGYLIRLLSSDDFGLVLNYERFLPNNFTVSGSAGHILVPKFENEKYYLGEISLRKYLFGDYQRMILGINVFTKYDNSINSEFTNAITAKIGYLWEWKYIFTSIEAGIGPGFVKNKNTEDFNFIANMADANLNFGFIF